MILVIDNYDSFVHNLARYFTLAGHECEIVRNDALSLEDIEDLAPEAIVLSPGPCTPAEAGICVDAVKRFGPRTPILGVCLGHQAIGEAYGGETIHAHTPLHGKAESIRHNAAGLFHELPNPMEVGRYHSLVTHIEVDSPLLVTAQTEDGTIMAMEHKRAPVYGVQFHPESVLTTHGQALIGNFSAIVKLWQAGKDKAA
ncbi:MAG: aminodeoxychorismate/anthranilate synthase component II [Alphaproteobacteria bacterium]|nr:aminodeoxychorismate/anthranilate synthase component II [Alphaproteobacteria bacterium]